MLLLAGTYNDAKTDPADQCKPCPEGTTTLTVTNAADNVNAITDCLLTKPGYGKQDASEAPGGPLKQCPVGELRLLHRCSGCACHVSASGAVGCKPDVHGVEQHDVGESHFQVIFLLPSQLSQLDCSEITL